MRETRLATAADAELIAEHRYRMFEEMGNEDSPVMREMRVNFVAWVRPRLEEGSYVGWLVQEGGRVVAGAGTWLMDFPPNLMDPGRGRSHLLNFYVDPEFRGRGLAYGLLKTAVEDARRRGMKVVSLTASQFGRPLYERNGFAPTNDMIRVLREGEA